jgi:DNA topoisomerase-1
MDTAITLTHKELLQVDRDYVKAASIVHLVYVSDRQPGILRLKKGKGFSYLMDNKPVKDKKELERIRQLVIPPAWTNVWICTSEKGHIQATGLDLRGRKQYRYHPLWNSLRNETKYHRMLEFGKALPLLRARVEEDLRKKTLSEEKVMATMVSLMERTYIRIGNNEYEKANGSYGLTTLKNKHVVIEGDRMMFSFKGKKGIQHDVSLRNKRLARIVSQCHDIPGKELFQYYAEDGSRHPIDSGMVNAYIREAMHEEFSAKDFRTWAGSLHALQAFRAIGEAENPIGEAENPIGEAENPIGEAENPTGIKKNINAVLDIVSGQLGNTRAVCRKYYVHPRLIQLYEDGRLVKYLREVDALEEEGADDAGLTAEEKILMKILRGNG